MIFKETWQQVLDGTKTQTRRPVKLGDIAVGTHDRIIAIECMTMPPKRLRISLPICIWKQWEIGQTYAIQPGRGKKAIGRIRITAIRRERLRSISLDDIRAEGCDSPYPELARRWWHTTWDSLIYRKPYRWEDNPEVWVLEFELAKEASDDIPN